MLISIIALTLPVIVAEVQSDFMCKQHSCVLRVDVSGKIVCEDRDEYVGRLFVTLSGWLGHSDKNITLNTYSHIIKSKEAQAANRMDIFYSKVAKKA